MEEELLTKCLLTEEEKMKTCEFYKNKKVGRYPQCKRGCVFWYAYHTCSVKRKEDMANTKLMHTKGEIEFIGCGATARFIFEKIELAADRGYGIIIEPVGTENNRGFNLYQVTPSLAKSATDLYEALKDIYDFLKSHGYRTDIVKQALAKAKGKNG